MYLFIYFRKTEEKIEFESGSRDKFYYELKKLSPNRSFDLAIVNQEALLTVEYNHGTGLIHYDGRTDEVFKKIKVNAENFSFVHRILENFVTDNGNSTIAQIFRKYQFEQEKKEKERYKNWKVKYDKRSKKEHFDILKPLSIAILITALIVLTSYYSITGEYKFIGQQTNFVRAEIVKIEIVRFGGRYYYQRIFYSYKFNSMNYQDSAIIDNRIGKRKIGDIIQIKFSVSYPERSKVIGHY